METTFGLPRYRFPPAEQVIDQIIAFCRETIDDGGVPVLLGYSLGKAQEILCSLDGAGLNADAPRFGLSDDPNLRAVWPIILQISSLQPKRCCWKSSDLPTQREPFADAGKDWAQTGRDDQRLGCRSKRNLSLSG